MEYLLKSSAIIILFYGCYKLFLQKETFFQSNRAFLILGLLMATVFPLIVIPIYVEYTSQPITTNFNFEQMPQTEMKNPWEPSDVLPWIYGLGATFFLSKLLFEITSLLFLLKKQPKQSIGKYTFIETNKNLSPFSFFNRIVYNPAQFTKSELQHIINHEKVHAQQLHSIDVLLIQLATALLWFNPFIWLYKKELCQNLEFIADGNAQHRTDCGKSYQMVLLKTSTANHQLALANNFYTSLIKKRIVMLHKSKSHRLKAWKYSLILPALAWFLMSFHTKTVLIEANANNDLLPNVSASATTLNGAPETTELKIIINKDFSEKEFENIIAIAKKEGVTLSFTNIKRNDKGEIIAISAEAKTKNGSSNFNLHGSNPIQPFVFNYSDALFSFGPVSTSHFKIQAQNTSEENQNIYVISKDSLKKGTKTEIIVSRNSNSDNNVFFSPEGTDSIFIVKKTPKTSWTIEDGKTVDIYAYQNDHTAKAKTLQNSENILFIVDDKKTTATAAQEIAPNTIQSVSVYKGDQAVNLYGAEGKDGVIVIKTKDSNTWTTDGGETIIIKDTAGKNTYEFISEEAYTSFGISKSTTDKTLESHKEALAQEDVNVKYSKLKRNKFGDIIKLKISLTDKDNKKSTATFEDSDGIPNIVFGKQKDNLFVKSGH
ncbi:M56 family metallopeptidase [Mangrovimonas sp. TPBH4]|uniref:M56 family metallopeptidase n=1 Tax=Mangrovimonas sp. TPBH4 TaxID=1645914 RepID=UPI000A4AD576|nr:M56 family metallopeptidase [Mangrovimonas sp. TPBH4]